MTPEPYYQDDFVTLYCGDNYVGVNPGHPWHEKAYQNIEESINVHGGLTYSGKCSGSICHTPKEGEPDNVYWLGFDCSHLYDLVPLNTRYDGLCSPDDRYRDVGYVKNQVEYLAEQAECVARTGKNFVANDQG